MGSLISLISSRNIYRGNCYGKWVNFMTSVLIYVLFGYPGSGKGSFSQALKEEGYEHFSTGDRLRDEVKKSSALGLQYQEKIERADHLLPSEIVEKFVEKRLQRSLRERKALILDGYPKTVAQCHFLDAFIKKNGLEDRVAFVFIDVDPKIAAERVLLRQSCIKCKCIYHLKFKLSKIPDVCDQCGEKLVSRTSDNHIDVQSRFELFEKTITQVVTYYKQSNRLKTVDGNASPEICYQAFLHFHRSLNTLDKPVEK